MSVPTGISARSSGSEKGSSDFHYSLLLCNSTKNVIANLSNSPIFLLPIDGIIFAVLYLLYAKYERGEHS